MIDPLLALSFNLQAQRGTYALLVGSGISRSASIPTGWEVTLDLVAKLAHVQNENCIGNEAAWYEAKFGKEPDYSEVLSSIAPTSAAQQQLLKSYFEPTEEERRENKKLPTLAHSAIAQLVGSGHIRVIITTNFDRLFEAALEAAGISPVVIASADAATGAPPLAHSKCTLIKVHGDYLDHRIRNSPEALSNYDLAMDKLLDQVFAEYGLIVCGWSGDYDVALRAAIERSKIRRYPMYWTGLSEPAGTSKNLITLHSAQFAKIVGADAFFSSVVEKVTALDEFDRPHPLSTTAAVSALKRYLSEERYRIQLRDFLVDESIVVGDAIDTLFPPLESVVPTQDTVVTLMKRIEAACEKLAHIFANGSFYAKPEHAKSFFDSFNQIVIKSQSAERYQVWIDLRKYPALILVYAAGIAAVASENYSVLREMASRTTFIRHDQDKNAPAPLRIHVHNVMEREKARKLLPGKDRRKTPLSDYLSEFLRETFKRLIPNEAEYELAFDNFEYLWCMLHVDTQKENAADRVWTPYGTFIWRRSDRSTMSSSWFKDQAKSCIDRGDNSWPPIHGGLFGGSNARLKIAYTEGQPLLDEISRSMW
jgi:hypothetical protein